MSRRKFSEIGRRSGLPIFKGKVIRSAANGIENFQDYWSEESIDDSDTSSSVIDDDQQEQQLSKPINKSKAYLNKTYAKSLSCLSFDAAQAVRTSTPYRNNENLGFSKSSIRPSLSRKSSYVESSIREADDSKSASEDSESAATDSKSEDGYTMAEKATSANMDNIQGHNVGCSPMYKSRRLTMRDASAYTTWSDPSIEQSKSETISSKNKRPAERFAPANAKSNVACSPMRKSRRLTLKDTSANTTWQNSLRSDSVKHVSFRNTSCSPMVQPIDHCSTAVFKSPRAQVNVGKSPSKQGGKSPSKHGGKSPSKHGGKSPSKHGGKSPSKHVGKSPSKHVGKSPSKHGDKSPLKHVGKSPSCIDGMENKDHSSMRYVESSNKSSAKQLISKGIGNSPYQQSLSGNRELYGSSPINNKILRHTLHEKTKFETSPEKVATLDNQSLDSHRSEEDSSVEFATPNSQDCATTVAEIHHTNDYEPTPNKISSENETSSPKKGHSKKHHSFQNSKLIYMHSPEKRSPEKEERSMRHETDYELSHNPKKTVKHSKITRASIFDDGAKDIGRKVGQNMSRSKLSIHGEGEIDKTAIVSDRNSTSKSKRKHKEENRKYNRDRMHSSDLGTHTKNRLEKVGDVESTRKSKTKLHNRSTSRNQSSHIDIDSNILLIETETHKKSLMLDNTSNGSDYNNATRSPRNDHRVQLNSPKKIKSNQTPTKIESSQTRGKSRSKKKTNYADARKSPRPVRTRIKPLRHWANERQVISYTPQGSFQVNVVEGTKVISPHLKFYQKTRKKLPEKNITLLGRKNKIYPFSFRESLEWRQPKDTTSFSMAKNFGSNAIQFGLLKIEPSGMKPEQFSPGSNLHFIVTKGSVNVCIHKTSTEFNYLESFIVPMKNSYSIKNLSNTRSAILSFTRFELPIFD